MAGRGRGRGRGLLIAKPSVPGGGNDTEVAPAEPVAKKDTRAVEALKDLEKEVDKVLDRGEDPSEEDLQRLEQLTVLSVTCPDDIQAVAKILYNKVVKNRELAKGVAVICDKLAGVEKDGMKFRSIILGLVQADYKNREELRAKSKDRFLSCLSFLSHLFITMRLANGEVMQPLVGPIYDCLDLMVESNNIDDVECEFLLALLVLIGRELQDNGDDRMQQFMNSVRTKIILQKTKPQVRCYMLELLESYMRHWQISSNDITRFYLDTMADILAGLVVDSS